MENQIKAILSKYGVTFDSLRDIDMNLVPQCLFELKDLRAKGMPAEGRYYIYDTQADSAELAEYKATEHFLLMPELQQLTIAELSKLQKLDSTIAALQEVIGDADQLRNSYKVYIYTMVSDVIKRSGVMYHYPMDEEKVELLKANAVRYFDYEMYSALQDLQKDIQQQMSEQVGSIIEGWEASDEGLSTLVASLKKMKTRVMADSQKIKFDGTAEPDAVKFYEMLILFLNEMIQSLDIL